MQTLNLRIYKRMGAGSRRHSRNASLLTPRTGTGLELRRQSAERRLEGGSIRFGQVLQLLQRHLAICRLSDHVAELCGPASTAAVPQPSEPLEAKVSGLGAGQTGRVGILVGHHDLPVLPDR